MSTDSLEIVKKVDGTFDLFRKGELIHSSIPDRWLGEELAKYGYCGQEYTDIRHQLDQIGRWRVVLSMGPD